jgi:hypothetical protein
MFQGIAIVRINGGAAILTLDVVQKEYSTYRDTHQDALREQEERIRRLLLPWKMKSMGIAGATT